MLGVIDPTKEGKEFLAPAEQTLLATKGAPAQVSLAKSCWCL